MVLLPKHFVISLIFKPYHLRSLNVTYNVIDHIRFCINVLTVVLSCSFSEILKLLAKALIFTSLLLD